MNEIVPFSKSTTTSYDNDYYGKTNSAFAKLMITNSSVDSINLNLNTFIPINKFKRLLPHMEEKVARLKFRFRYHNGQLVDFNNQQFSFSLRFDCKFDCKY
jgi:hypothetical protein